MCYVCPKCEIALQDLLTHNVEAKKAFTIWEIVHSFTSWCPTCYKDLSTHARDLFNRHNKVWDGYACYPIPNGPLLFFPIPRYFDVRIGKIATAIKETGFHET